MPRNLVINASKTTLVSKNLRFHKGLQHRAVHLLPRLEADPNLAPRGRLSIPDVLRIAMEAGMSALEDRFTAQTAGPVADQG